MKVLLELRAVVEATPEAVAAVLLDAGPGGRSPLAATEVVERRGDDEFTVVRDGSRMTVSIDRVARSITLQSEWWYRGVTSVEADPRGSVVVHRIVDVAPSRGWAVRMVSRGPLNAAPTVFATQVEQLGRAVGAVAWVVPG